jgi:streptogramin lyase
MRCLLMVLAALAVASASAHAQESKYYELPKGDFPHDVAVGPIGEVWYAGQNLGMAGRLNPASGEIERISLGKKSAPHGVIVGPDGAPWFTDGYSLTKRVLAVAAMLASQAMQPGRPCRDGFVTSRGPAREQRSRTGQVR